MQYSIYINQAKSLEWGLNPQQSILFSFVYTVPSWANEVQQNGKTYYAISKSKIIEELPLLTDKPDTTYRLLKQLAEHGLVELSSTSKITLLRLTSKAKDWNVYPDSEVGNKSADGRKNIRPTSEKNPTNHNTNNHNTNNTTTPISPKGDDDEVAYKTIVDLYHENLPNLPTVRLPTSARRKAVRARIKDDAKRKELDWWAGYFKYVSTMPFLNGANDRGWTANFDWLINETNMVKVIEGKYQHD